ncbi:asparagine synthase [Actinomadura roseirufa]|uniref:asparagine synthase n=1 Tax=Actinomadura roseirufa TaxID=2094049 RepID=UPI001F5EAAF3|nr:asparagine synthase [Actinomadura roseirufa]
MWQWDGGSYTTLDGRGRVTPYPHPMVEQCAATDGARTVLIVRERVLGRPATPAAVVPVHAGDLDRIIAEAYRWPVDHLLIEFTPRRPLRIRAGAVRATPLFLAHREGILHGSWDMADLRSFAGDIAPQEATRLLIYRPRYSTGTPFTGIHRLTERATATFGGDLVITYPDPIEHAEPHGLATTETDVGDGATSGGADVLAAFTTGIDIALDARPIEPTATVCHLTGGLDSGSIGTRMARRWPGQVDTATLIVIGPGREQQIRRRAQMRERVPFGSRDLCLDTRDRLLFGPGCGRVRGEPLSPYDEPLYELFTELNAQIAALGAHTLVTGLGGDEMVAVGSAESARAALDKAQNFDLPWLGPRARAAIEYGDIGIAPPAMAGGITLLAAETVAPPLLRAGLWPVHPFAHRALIELGDQLPFHWRELKQLQRRHLATFGLSHDACNPAERESFAELVEASLLINGLPLVHRILREGSPLIEAGLIDPDGLAATVAELGGISYREDVHSKLLEVIALDQAARAFLP